MFGVCLKMRSSKGRFKMGTKIMILMELEKIKLCGSVGFQLAMNQKFCHSSGPVDPGS